MKKNSNFQVPTSWKKTVEPARADRLKSGHGNNEDRGDDGNVDDRGDDGNDDEGGNDSRTLLHPNAPGQNQSQGATDTPQKAKQTKKVWKARARARTTVSRNAIGASSRSCSSCKAGCHCPHFSQALMVALKVITSPILPGLRASLCHRRSANKARGDMCGCRLLQCSSVGSKVHPCAAVLAAPLQKVPGPAGGCLCFKGLHKGVRDDLKQRLLYATRVTCNKSSYAHILTLRPEAPESIQKLAGACSQCSPFSQALMAAL